MAHPAEAGCGSCRAEPLLVLPPPDGGTAKRVPPYKIEDKKAMPEMPGGGMGGMGGGMGGMY